MRLGSWPPGATGSASALSRVPQAQPVLSLHIESERAVTDVRLWQAVMMAICQPWTEMTDVAMSEERGLWSLQWRGIYHVRREASIALSEAATPAIGLEFGARIGCRWPIPSPSPAGRGSGRGEVAVRRVSPALPVLAPRCWEEKAVPDIVFRPASLSHLSYFFGRSVFQLVSKRTRVSFKVRKKSCVANVHETKLRLEFRPDAAFHNNLENVLIHILCIVPVGRKVRFKTSVRYAWA